MQILKAASIQSSFEQRSAAQCSAALANAELQSRSNKSSDHQIKRVRGSHSRAAVQIDISDK
jgi:hypothetical protein